MLPIPFLLRIDLPIIRVSLNTLSELMALKKYTDIVIIRDEQEFPVDRDKICQELIMIKTGLESGMEEERTVTCPNITRGLEFPANLSFARDKWWKIRCSVCGSDVCRVEKTPAVDGDNEHPYILEPSPV